jgi:hypothetical protein
VHCNWVGPAREIRQFLECKDTVVKMLFDVTTGATIREVQVFRVKALPKIADVGVSNIRDFQALCKMGNVYCDFAKATHCRAIKRMEMAPYPGQFAAQLFLVQILAHDVANYPLKVDGSTRLLIASPAL